MASDDQNGQGDGAGNATLVKSIGGDVIAYYEQILEDVPEAGGDGVENILEQIAQAADEAGVDAPWRAGGMGQYVDRPLVVTGIRKMESDYGSGLSYFLVVDGADRMTGEKVTFTTGSLSTVAQLLKLHQLGSFPAVVVPKVSKRPTKEGFFPQHLEVMPR